MLSIAKNENEIKISHILQNTYAFLQNILQKIMLIVFLQGKHISFLRSTGKNSYQSRTRQCLKLVCKTFLHLHVIKMQRLFVVFFFVSINTSTLNYA